MDGIYHFSDDFWNVQIHPYSTPGWLYTDTHLDDVFDQSPLVFQPPDQNLSDVAEFPMRSAKYLGHPNALFQLLQYLAYDLPLLSSKMGEWSCVTLVEPRTTGNIRILYIYIYYVYMCMYIYIYMWSIPPPIFPATKCDHRVLCSFNCRGQLLTLTGVSHIYQWVHSEGKESKARKKRKGISVKRQWC